MTIYVQAINALTISFQLRYLSIPWTFCPSNNFLLCSMRFSQIDSESMLTKGRAIEATVVCVLRQPEHQVSQSSKIKKGGPIMYFQGKLSFPFFKDSYALPDATIIITSTNYSNLLEFSLQAAVSALSKIFGHILNARHFFIPGQIVFGFKRAIKGDKMN